MAIAERTLAPPRSRPKAKAQGRSLQLMPVLIVAAGAIVVIGLLRIVQTSQATTAGFAMTAMQQEKLELEANISQLEAEVATLSSLDRIEREAARLGLTLPEDTSYLEVNAVWPADAEDALPVRFAPSEEEQPDGSPGSSGWWDRALDNLPFR